MALSFPPRPRSLQGRRAELKRLADRVTREHPAALALVGPGGSGKSTLAAALGHRVAKDFPGGTHWFRVAAWSTDTLTTMLAVRFGTARKGARKALRRHFEVSGETLIVLDNHEDDAAVAELLNAFADAPVSWVLTARRCLLAGITVYPVNPPLVLRGAAPFPRVAQLTGLLRHNPLSLSVANALVEQRKASVRELRQYLLSGGAERVAVIEDEDDLPEVRLLVEFIWQRIGAGAKRILGVLAHSGGDHVDTESLLVLARSGRNGRAALRELLALCVVQEPFAGRFTVHATVRRALVRATRAEPKRGFEHYIGLLERDPARLDAEQTHLFAAMDHAQESGTLGDRLRVARLLHSLGL